MESPRTPSSISKRGASEALSLASTESLPPHTNRVITKWQKAPTNSHPLVHKIYQWQNIPICKFHGDIKFVILHLPSFLIPNHIFLIAGLIGFYKPNNRLQCHTQAKATQSFFYYLMCSPSNICHQVLILKYCQIIYGDHSFLRPLIQENQLVHEGKLGI